MRPTFRLAAAAHHFAALDGYRFVAALFVVLYHYDAEFGIGFSRLSPAVVRLNAFVDFFFILSGFVIAVAYRNRMVDEADYFRFLKARVARLYPLHLLTLAGSISLLGVAAVTGQKPNHPEILGLSALPANLMLIHAWGLIDHPSFNAVSWSISAEWFCYLLAPLVFLSLRRLPAIVNLALPVVFVLAMVAARRAAGLGPWTEAAYDFGAFRALPAFFLGALIAFQIERIAAAFPSNALIAPASFVAALAALHFQANEIVVAAAFALCIAGSAVRALHRGRDPMASAPMQALGGVSYTLYMTHYLLATPVLFAARKLGWIGTWSGAMAALATLCVAVTLCFLIRRYFEMPAKAAILRMGAPPIKSEARI